MQVPTKTLPPILGLLLGLWGCNGTDFVADADTEPQAATEISSSDSELMLEDDLLDSEEEDTESEESVSKVDNILTKFDADESGSLDAAELKQLLKKVKRFVRHRGPNMREKGRHNEMGRGRRGPPPQGVTNRNSLFDCKDQNEDGVLSKEEFIDRDELPTCLQSS